MGWFRFFNVKFSAIRVIISIVKYNPSSAKANDIIPYSKIIRFVS